MGYDVNDNMVRVDRFKPRGKWYDTLAVDMAPHYRNPDLHDAVRLAIQDKYPDMKIGSWTFVCLEPYHQNSHPVMLKAKEDE